MTTYKSIAGFPAYRVGDDGTVWSCQSGHWKQLKAAECSGSTKVVLCAPSGKKMKSVHVLVMEAFRGPRPAGMQVRHFPDPDIWNNALSNLRWGTAKENAADKISHGTDPSGTRNPKAKLDEAKVREIRQRVDSGEPRKVIARAYAVSPEMIGYIARGQHWAGVS